MSESDDKKKVHERQVLEDALGSARAKGGEARRNADWLSGEIDSTGERPDLVIRAPRGRIVGIEHFRIDHFVKHDKKAQSAVMPLSAKSSKKLGKYALEVAAGVFSDEMLSAMGDVCSTTIKMSKDACMRDLTRSLDARLFGDNGHALKLKSYRENMAALAPSGRIELGYLVEVHSDFGSLVYHDGGTGRKVRTGECPMFKEVHELLFKAAGDVKWIVLAFYGAFGDEIVDAAVINCGNGMFDRSLERQGFKCVEYLGLGKDEPRNPQRRKGRTEVEHKVDDIYTFRVEDTSDEVDVQRIMANSMADGAKALELAKRRCAFTCTTGVELVFDLLWDRALGIAGPITPEWAWHTLVEMNSDERKLRMAQFAKRWGISDD